MEFDLPFIWAAIIAFAILVYVMLDGFDLGIGILFPFLKGKDKDLAMNSIAPVWDGNETWLVLGGGGLFAVFPLAYATVLPALYVPLVIMLLALVFRGVAFEFRWRTEHWRGVWDVGFAAGSTLAALMQGIALGALVQGIEIEGRAYAGGWWDWLSPFSLMTGVALMTGYSLLGSTWLILKAEGKLRDQMRNLSFFLALGTIGFIGLVSAATPFLQPVYFSRWFVWPTLLFSVTVPLLIAIAMFVLFKGLQNKRDELPFLASLMLFMLCFAGLGISFYPCMVPPSLTIWQAAAPDSSLAFLLIGAAVLVPLILIYTAYAYYVFRGKVKPGEGYH